MKKHKYNGVAKTMVYKPMFKQRVMRDRTKYNRKQKYKGEMS